MKETGWRLEQRPGMSGSGTKYMHLNVNSNKQKENVVVVLESRMDCNMDQQGENTRVKGEDRHYRRNRESYAQ